MPRTNRDPKTGDGFIQLAQSKGASVTPAGTKHGVEFTKISTPSGSMFITPGKHTLDPRTRKNYKHWFRLLGLLSVLIYIVDVAWGWLHLPPIF
jgi:hypothetical protein